MVSAARNIWWFIKGVFWFLWTPVVYLFALVVLLVMAVCAAVAWVVELGRDSRLGYPQPSDFNIDGIRRGDKELMHEYVARVNLERHRRRVRRQLQWGGDLPMTKDMVRYALEDTQGLD